MDPEEVTSERLTALDKALDANRVQREILTHFRAIEFTREYDRQRKARIRSAAPTRAA